jgi:hypothetical protein
MFESKEPDEFKDFLMGWDNSVDKPVSREYLELKKFLNLELDSSSKVVSSDFVESFKQLEG